jgi:hypothetical protein
MYKGTFIAIAEVVGQQLSGPAATEQARPDGWSEREKWGGSAQISRPIADNGRSGCYPWPLQVAGNRRCAD